MQKHETRPASASAILVVPVSLKVVIGATRRTLTGRSKAELRDPVSICRPSCASVSRSTASSIKSSQSAPLSADRTGWQALLARRSVSGKGCAIRGELRGLVSGQKQVWRACRVTQAAGDRGQKAEAREIQATTDTSGRVKRAVG